MRCGWRTAVSLMEGLVRTAIWQRCRPGAAPSHRRLGAHHDLQHTQISIRGFTSWLGFAGAAVVSGGSYTISAPRLIANGST